MRVILINPSQTAELSPDVYLPINLAYIAAFLRRYQHKVKIIDLQIECKSIEKLKSEIKKFDPQIVGITSMTPNFPYALKIAELVKEMNRNIKTVFGGTHVTATPKETLKNKYVDFVVIGEGEETAAELVNTLQHNKNLKNVKGIGFKKNGKIIINSSRPYIKNLDELPLPVYDIVNIEEYKKHKNGILILTSRGCPFNCIFCASHLVNGKKIRRRSIENIMEELKFLKNKYEVKRIAFYDDTFTLDRKYVIELCKRMIEENLSFEWWCNTRVDTVDEELLKWMKKAGCNEISYGFESGTQRILDYIKKGFRVEESKKAVEMTKKIGIDMHGFFIINFPNETKKEMRKTIKFARKMPIIGFRLSLATPYPGTELYEICKKNSYLSKEQIENWEKYSYLKNFYIHNFYISEKDLKKLLRKTNIMLILNTTYFKSIFTKIMRRVLNGDFYVVIRALRYLRNILTIK